MKRKYNFSAGPATMPETVIKKIAEDFYCHPQLGYSIVEESHRSKFFLDIIETTKKKLLKLLRLNTRYSVVFLHGGASGEFFRIPMNLLGNGKKASYIDTGIWTTKAIKEAQLFGDIHIAGSSETNGFKHIPKENELSIPKDSEYLYLCSNNTIYGTQYQSYPKTSIPLVGDFTSDILSREIDLNRFGIIFAGSQKNLGPSGLSIVIIREDLLNQCRENLPSMCSYPILVEANSVFNTCPTFQIYFVNLTLDWMEEQGGVTAIEKKNRKNAAMIYQAIDNHDIYIPYCKKEDRSIMNITFFFEDDEKTQHFLQGAQKLDLVNLKGHRLAGGIRVSMYNAFPSEGAEKLAQYLEDFSRKNS